MSHSGSDPQEVTGLRPQTKSRLVLGERNSSLPPSDGLGSERLPCPWVEVSVSRHPADYGANGGPAVQAGEVNQSALLLTRAELRRTVLDVPTRRRTPARLLKKAQRGSLYRLNGSFWWVETADGWRTSYRIEPQGLQPVVAEIRIFPAARFNANDPVWRPQAPAATPEGGVPSGLLKLQRPCPRPSPG